MPTKILDVVYQFPDSPEWYSGKVVYSEFLGRYTDTEEFAREYGINDEEILLYTDTLDSEQIAENFDGIFVDFILPYD